MATTKTEAYEAMLRHHGVLGDQVQSRAAAVRRAVDSAFPYEPSVAELVAYIGDEVLPHALAEEHTIYPEAAARAELADTVNEMIAEHRRLASVVEELAAAGSGLAAAAKADEVAGLFVAHVAKENDFLLPPLVDDDQVDLAQLLVQMHRLTEAAQQQTPTSEDVSAPDPEAVVVSLLLEAASDLAHAGQGDRACQLAAAAWTALRVPRPDLAVRVTAALHRLARLATAEPVTLRAPADSIPGADPELDVRTLAPAQRHETIFAAYGALSPGAGFVLVNDHDPKPLRYQFEAEHTDEFTRDVIESGPEVWRVRIGRSTSASAVAGNGADREEEPELDVRSLAHGRRHDVIFAAYGALSPGAGFVLVNDHDPRPLRYQFETQHREQFTWDYLESGPRTWRVRIGRAAGVPVR